MTDRQKQRWTITEGLKISRPQGHAGSIPAPGTSYQLTCVHRQADWDELAALGHSDDPVKVTRDTVATSREVYFASLDRQTLRRLRCEIHQLAITISAWCSSRS